MVSTNRVTANTVILPGDVLYAAQTYRCAIATVVQANGPTVYVNYRGMHMNMSRRSICSWYIFRPTFKVGQRVFLFSGTTAILGELRVFSNYIAYQHEDRWIPPDKIAAKWCAP